MSSIILLLTSILTSGMAAFDVSNERYSGCREVNKEAKATPARIYSMDLRGALAAGAQRV